jgi:hypothetical protein
MTGYMPASVRVGVTSTAQLAPIAVSKEMGQKWCGVAAEECRGKQRSRTDAKARRPARHCQAVHNGSFPAG